MESGPHVKLNRGRTATRKESHVFYCLCGCGNVAEPHDINVQASIDGYLIKGHVRPPGKIVLSKNSVDGW